MFYLISNDSHVRTAINKLLCEDNRCVFVKSPEFILPLLKEKKDTEAILIIDDHFSGQALSRLFYETVSLPIVKRIFLLGTALPSSLHLASDKLSLISRNPSALFLDEVRSTNAIYGVEPEARERLETFLLGSSDHIKNIREKVLKVARSESHIIICGETGTGKNQVARSLHISRTGKDNLVLANCAQLNGELADVEIFGNCKGAYTGSESDREGLLQKAAKVGGLFLDEIETLTLSMQAKLLHFLETGEFSIVGSSELLQTHFGVTAATNEDITTLLLQSKMRRDFFMRLGTEIIWLAPLREHMEDIPELIRHKEKLSGYASFIENYDLFFEYNWPGNVRELFSAVERIHTENPDRPRATMETINQFHGVSSPFFF